MIHVHRAILLFVDIRGIHIGNDWEFSILYALYSWYYTYWEYESFTAGKIQLLQVQRDWATGGQGCFWRASARRSASWTRGSSSSNVHKLYVRVKGEFWEKTKEHVERCSESCRNMKWSESRRYIVHQCQPINHPFGNGVKKDLWLFGGWFIIVSPTLGKEVHNKA